MGLKAWHAFAVGVLDYSEKTTLPPASAEDFCRWLAVFQSPAAAAVHLSYVRWACQEFGKNLLWNDASITSLLRGMKK